MKPKAKKPKAVKSFGILNKFGDFWTTETFHSEDKAQQIILLNCDKWNWDSKDFKVIEVLIKPL